MNSEIELLKKHEGLRLKPYQCTAGKLTIGYGRNLEDNGITTEEADILLANDVKNCRIRLAREIYYFIDLDQVRQSVLVNMAFNLGVDGLLKFKQTLIYVEHGNYKAAAVEMLNSRWAEQVGSRAHELSDMMREGRYA